MVKIDRNNKELIIKLDTKVGYEVLFRRSSDHELDAILLKMRLEKLFNDRIQQIKREAYEAGWKDKSGHKAKRTWFSGCINNDFRNK